MLKKELISRNSTFWRLISPCIIFCLWWFGHWTCGIIKKKIYLTPSK